MQTQQQPPGVILYPEQGTFLESSAPTVTFQGGAGSGKTFAGCAKALYNAQMQPGSRGMIIGASYPSLKRSILPHLETIGAQVGLRDRWQFNRADMQIVLPNGSMLWLASADRPEALLGADLAWVWGDEVGLWKHDAYRYVVGRLRQPGYFHQFFATYTPKGRNWAYEELGKPREGLEIITSSSLSNPFVGEDFRERLRREYGEGTHWWRQEVLGEFVAFEGLVYIGFDAEAHVATPDEDVQFVRTAAGVDWGWTNPGVMLVVSLDSDDRTWVREELYERERPIEWWAEQGQRLVAEYGVERLYCDPAEPANIAALKRAGLPAEPAKNAVLPGIAAVAGRINSGRERVLPACANLIAEYGMYSWKTQRDGTVKADEPEKVHDHACDARRYAEMGLTNPAPRGGVRFL